MKDRSLVHIPALQFSKCNATKCATDVTRACKPAGDPDTSEVTSQVGGGYQRQPWQSMGRIPWGAMSSLADAN